MTLVSDRLLYLWQGAAHRVRRWTPLLCDCQAVACYEAVSIWNKHVASIRKYVALLPILFGLAAFVLFAFIGQMQEIYQRFLESWDIWRLLLGSLLTTFLGILIFYSWLSLTRERTFTVHGSDEDVYQSPRAPHHARDTAAFLVGAMAPLGLIGGLVSMHWTLVKRSSTYLTATRDIPVPPNSRWEYLPTLGMIDFSISEIHSAVPPLFFVALLSTLPMLRAWRHRRSHGARRLAWWLAAVIVIASLVVFPLLSAPNLIWLTRALGPLALAAMQLIAGLALMMVLVKVSRILGLPLILLLCVAVPVFAYRAELRDTAGWFVAEVGRTVGLGATSGNKEQLAPLPDQRQALRRTAISESAAERRSPRSTRTQRILFGSRASVYAALVLTPPSVIKSYWRWLLAHQASILQFAADNRKYPVYIVSAQGGGIYAAAAAATFLSHIQDREPTFRRHLFAVSGVSGGSVGTALSAAVDSLLPPCNPRTPKVRQVTEQDHLSPVLGLLVAEYAEKAFLGLSARNVEAAVRRAVGWPERNFTTRASALQSSLQYDTEAANTCTRARLGAPFASDWKPGDTALVLNTTLADTGERVAFAPFLLNDIGQGSLSSTADHNFRYLLAKRTEPITLSEAAVASARFPGLMPALPLATNRGQINLADGGYSDNSGVATASAIYDALTKLAQNTTDPKLKALLKKVEPRVVVLTGSERLGGDLKGMRGTTLPDLMAPVLAILNVRSRISAREVFLAQDRHNADSKRFSLVHLDEDFTLELGWTFSRLTSDIISLMVARPEFCRRAESAPGAHHPEALRRATQLLEKNACVVKDILDAIKVPPKAALEPPAPRPDSSDSP